MYQSWIQDQEELNKTYKDYALFIGAFSNPKMASEIARRDNPQFKSSSEDFEESSSLLSKDVVLPVSNKKRKVM